MGPEITKDPKRSWSRSLYGPRNHGVGGGSSCRALYTIRIGKAPGRFCAEEWHDWAPILKESLWTLCWEQWMATVKSVGWWKGCVQCSWVRDCGSFLQNSNSRRDRFLGQFWISLFVSGWDVGYERKKSAVTYYCPHELLQSQSCCLVQSRWLQEEQVCCVVDVEGSKIINWNVTYTIKFFQEAQIS